MAVNARRSHPPPFKYLLLCKQLKGIFPLNCLSQNYLQGAKQIKQPVIESKLQWEN